MRPVTRCRSPGPHARRVSLPAERHIRCAPELRVGRRVHRRGHRALPRRSFGSLLMRGFGGWATLEARSAANRHIGCAARLRWVGPRRGAAGPLATPMPAPRGAQEPCGAERAPPPARRSGSDEAGGSPNPGTWARVASGPDNAGTDQHRQMVRVRQARRTGVRKEPASERSSRVRPARHLAAMGWAATRIRASARRTPRPIAWVGRGGHGEGLRRTRGEVAGA